MKVKIRLIELPNKLDVIKLVKRNFNLGLKEAKDIVDNGYLFFGKPEDFENTKPEYIIPEVSMQYIRMLELHLKKLNTKFEIIEIKKNPKTVFKPVKELEDIGKFVIVSVELIQKFQERNQKKLKEIAELKEQIKYLSQSNEEYIKLKDKLKALVYGN